MVAMAVRVEVAVQSGYSQHGPDPVRPVACCMREAEGAAVGEVEAENAVEAVTAGLRLVLAMSASVEVQELSPSCQPVGK